MSGSWFSQGTDNETIEAAERDRSRFNVQKRLWMPPGGSKKIVVLDDQPFRIYEHNPKINGDYKFNWFRCRAPEPCPLCVSRVDRYFIGFVTVIDVKGFKTKKGDHIKNFRQLLPMKTKALKRFNTKVHRKTSLVNALLDISRLSDEDPGCGNDWEFVDYANMDDEKYWSYSKREGKLIRPEPFDYMKVLAPMTADEMMAIGGGGFGGGGSVGGSDNNSQISSDEDTPY